jgi:hypothetical protein
MVLKGVGVRVAEQAAGAGSVAMFGVGRGRLVCEDVLLRMPGDPLAAVGQPTWHDDAFVIAAGAGGTSSAITMVRSRAAGNAVFLDVHATVTGSVAMEWNAGEFVSPRRLLVAEGAATGQVSVDCHLHDATFCCGEGIAALGDSLDRPDSPRLRVRATGCRFVVPGADRPFVLQAGVGEPDRYRAALTWIDERSRYEGSGVFQRIDGAAERVDVGFREILPPLFHEAEVGASPDPSVWPGWR